MTIEPSRTPAVPSPTRVGQGTAIEQSRAAAEVHAAVVVAQQVPRITATAVAQMRESCTRMRLAERAFYRYPRGGQTVTGASVHLARELARCWGNIQYGIAELRRDDEHGQSEMQAWAWDVQTNARSSMIFVVPHKRDGKKGQAPEVLTDLRDVYENNANMGARRLREVIFSVLPTWFVEEAKDLCATTVEKGEGDKPLPQRIADAVKVAEQWGITPGQLEQRLGRPQSAWIPPDLAQLLVIFQSVRRGEIRLDEEFAPERVTAGEIQAQATVHSGSDPVANEEDPESEAESTLVDEGWPAAAQPPDAKPAKRTGSAAKA